ncbi:Signal transduction histidine kinase [Rhizobium sp. RU20A]|uniref:response regulator n=1 Tax=Rhizobium sp. RU20A TaxID=1907412 RepID=UPI00095683F7|nr:response regulator [Rhizobium sp. RU20A]SIQ86078.1 Signal transduction histidine kinase [Rhizobium sp. RU20A]
MHRKNASARLTGGLGLDPLVATGLAAALLFFIISAATGLYTTKSLQTNNLRVVQTHDLIVAIGQLQSEMQDAETGQRGYLLTGDERYLEPFEQAKVQIVSRLAALDGLVSQSPFQSRRLGDLRAHIKTKFDELERTIDLKRTGDAAGALQLVNSDLGKRAMDSIRATVADMRAEETRQRAERLVDMGRSYTAAYAVVISTAVLGLALTLVIGVLLRRLTLARRRQEWLQRGQVGLGQSVIGDRNTDALSESILRYLTDYVGAVAGIMYVRTEDGFQRSATFGVPETTVVPQRIGRNDGLYAHVLTDPRPIVVGQVPDGYISFGSGLGRDKPAFLTLSPASIDGEIRAVYELGFLNGVPDHVLELFDQSSSTIATAIRSAEFRTQLQRLLTETQRQAEELQVQGEELRVSNEELEEQGKALKESQARLEQQQVELEQTNSQLEEQARELERQRDDLEMANDAIQAKAREVEQASRYKSDFLANMSHELRTPLNSSLILAKLLADNTEENLTPEQVRYAQTIQASGNDLLNLINDILDLSKIEAGHVEVHAEPVLVERMVKSLQQVFDPLASNKGLQLSIDVAADVPVVIETDQQRLEQVLRNLLANAIKFTEKGTVSLHIRPAPDGHIAISVTDTGIGIAEDQQKRIFEAFHQADSTISRRFGGTGLGLSISRELVRLLGGTLHLTSRAGEGSTFTVVLPEVFVPEMAARPAPAMIPAPPVMPEQGVVELPFAAPPRAASSRARPPAIVEDDRKQVKEQGRKLLIIEDDHSFSMILRDLARDLDFQTLVAGTAQEALELARQFMPSAIVLDVGLPDQSGLSVLDRLKSDVRTRHIPIHIISADDYTERALSLGAVGYALKPVQREQLVDVLKSLDAKISQNVRRVLIVEDNDVQRDAVAKLIGSPEVETICAATAAECLALLREQTFDCMVLDLSLPDASGYALLETISQDSAHSFPPVIVYTGRVLTTEEEQKLRRYSKSIIIKGAKSPERLLDEVTLFLHQVVSDLPDEQQKMIRRARNRDALLEGRRILVVEDDVRNVYALTNILEPRGAVVEIARNGEEALQKLEQSRQSVDKKIDLVLMDVMMPIMDGLTATRHIRKIPDFAKLPVITLTAKAMPDDQQRCIEAGANDYMAKPLDVEKLLSLVRVWMPQ